MNAIKRARYERGYSIDDVAHQAGISPTTLSRWENGHHVPSAPNLKRLADFYRVPVRDLLDSPTEAS